MMFLAFVGLFIPDLLFDNRDPFRPRIPGEVIEIPIFGNSTTVAYFLKDPQHAFLEVPGDSTLFYF